MSSGRQHLIFVFQAKSNPDQRQKTLEQIDRTLPLKNLHRFTEPQGTDHRAHWYEAYIQDGDLGGTLARIRQMPGIERVQAGNCTSARAAAHQPTAQLDRRLVLA